MSGNMIDIVVVVVKFEPTAAAHHSAPTRFVWSSDERVDMVETALAVTVTVYGSVGALASVLQLRHMHKRGSSRDVSLAYLAIVGGGYALWLTYGIAVQNVPLIVVDALGAAGMLVTIAVALRLRERRSDNFSIGVLSPRQQPATARVRLAYAERPAVESDVSPPATRRLAS